MLGKLRHLVTITSPDENLNDFGEDDGSSDTTVGTRYARVEELSGKELAWARELQPQITHRVTIRYEYNLNLQAKDNISWEGRTLQLISPPREDEQRMYYNFDCVEVV